MDNGENIGGVASHRTSAEKETREYAPPGFVSDNINLKRVW